MVVLPALALLCVWLCSLVFLVRIFRQEQAWCRAPSAVSSGMRPCWRSSGAGAPGSCTAVWGDQPGEKQPDPGPGDALLHDPLTGIMNRRAFDQDRARLDQEGPYWLVLFDVDNFKGVNDSWGHGVGDAVLFRVATIIMARTLGEAQVYRIGGDEFAALLPWELGEVECRLTHLLAGYGRCSGASLRRPITLSAGGRITRKVLPTCSSGPMNACTGASTRGGTAGIWRPAGLPPGRL